MSEMKPPHGKKHFNVTVGLSTVKVQCETKQEAIAMAKSRLGTEVPRMWDMIHSIEDKDFRVDQVDT